MNPELMAQQALQVETFLKELANRNRLLVLCALLERELSVSELNERVPLSQSALSQHLTRLRQAGLVSARKQGQSVFYALAGPRVKPLLTTLYRLFCQE